MDDLPHRPPVTLDALLRRTRELGFDAACESRTGGLLCVLAASKPGGRLLELGTGTGVGTAWLLDGMDSAASLVSVDTDARVQAGASWRGRPPDAGAGRRPRVRGGAGAQVLRPCVRRRLGWQVRRLGRGLGAVAAGRILCRGRPIATTQLANRRSRGPCSPALGDAFGASPGARSCPCLGKRPGRSGPHRVTLKPPAALRSRPARSGRSPSCSPRRCPTSCW